MYQVTQAARQKLTLYAVRQRQRAAGMSDQDLVAFWLANNNEPLPSGVRDETADEGFGSGGDTGNSGGDNIDPLLKALAEKIAQQAGKSLDEPRVIELIKQHAPKSDVRTLEIKNESTGTTVKIESPHARFDEAFELVQVDPLMLVGPAGSGKTTLGEQLAAALEVPFAFTGAITQEFKLMGFLRADGQVVRTPFRECYENGGLFLFDEMDASLPQAVLAFNAALANGHCDFPDRMVKRHPKFYAVAACNTWGKGADQEFVGRYQQDGTALDRFSTLYLSYDEALEIKLAGNAKWVKKIQAIRAAVASEKVRHCVSMRASIRGAKLLARGKLSESQIMESVVWKGLDRNVVEKISKLARV